MSRASRSSSSALSARYFFASSRARSLNAGDILSRRFLKFFAISAPVTMKKLLTSFRNVLQMPVKQIICHRHEAPIPLRIATLVSADQENRRPPRVKSIENTQLPLVHLATQFLHVGMPRADDGVRVRPGQRGAEFLQKLNLGSEFCLLAFRERIPPHPELMGVLNNPIPHKEYNSHGII